MRFLIQINFTAVIGEIMMNVFREDIRITTTMLVQIPYRNQHLANRDCRIILPLLFQFSLRLESLLVEYCESAVRWELFHWMCNYQLLKEVSPT
jgi:hypothetical protein